MIGGHGTVTWEGDVILSGTSRRCKLEFNPYMSVPQIYRQNPDGNWVLLASAGGEASSVGPS